jgi:hypothetical protein
MIRTDIVSSGKSSLWASARGRAWTMILTSAAGRFDANAAFTYPKMLSAKKYLRRKA